jgi:single-stranded DNA-binding protein
MRGHEVCFAGNIGSDVTVRQVEGGRSIAEFSFAQEVNPGPNEDKRVNWWAIECWDALADKISGSSYASKPEMAPKDDGEVKGARIIINGWVHFREWRDDDDVKHTKQVIVADEIAFSTFYGPLDVVRRPLASGNKKKRK